MKKLLFLLFALNLLVSNGQTDIADSLKQKLEMTSDADQRMRLIIKDGWKINPENPSLALFYANYAARDTLEVNNPYLLDSLYRLTAFAYGDLNNRAKTLDAHLKRIRVLSSLDTLCKPLASAYFEAAHVLKGQGNDSLALPYFEKCLAIATETNYKTQKGQVLIDLGGIYYTRGNSKKAISAYTEAAEIFSEYDHLAFLVGVSKIKTAAIYSDKGKTEQAYKLIEEAILLPDTSQWQFIDYSGDIFATAGEIYLDNGLYGKAISQLKMAQGLYERHNKYFYLPQVYRQLANAYRAIDVDSAFVYLDWYVTLNDSVINQKNNELLTQMRFEFEEDRKEREIEFLQEEKNIIEENRILLEADNSRKSLFINLGIAALILLVGLLILAIYSFNQSRKKNRIVNHQKALVEARNKEVEDSIAYAERIQRAVIPEQHWLSEVFPKSFVIYLPKDVLSGDFYWVYNVTTNTNTKLKLFAVGDCTGHGVPGALLSILGINYLNLGAVSSNVNSTGEALDYLNEGILHTFGKSSQTIRDGMDIVLGAINPETNELYYSCAKNSMYIVRKGEIITLKGEKKAIGNDEYEKSFQFSTEQFQLEKGDVIYAISDGFQDQFGGPKGKKFKIGSLKKRFVEIADKDMIEQKELLQKAFNDWAGDQEQVDDVTVMAIRI